ncbi:hypothetical protein A3H22_01310 [Candidatus Peribacteria bacterium RIFCSPLOWO2_12_FULL_55_15]|nr:MAG: hypothetical protein A2789_02110 [Candidatus Peribacteria bacterium RIFCSPHIGHO2_01_FULL_54_22]OGJ63464.1 MAG: hypothetical protein A3D12_01825 [Candidatus Peribacteria bacterium RIFCSPHIGHO2_02_FULL_55_24]OGJ68696.1 MAG: hypothetical protein A2947_00865 [Candidatus Peribacteria bacterium RIFCSPLOWO2_01_FULL_54_110]OGJ68720.1 MAG: hypothetical protein A3H90_00185 [Candidatus Peribacteria bacterium RIFCSPLOWO2_02_FULL_55_36]OGJ71023.1 MAG: hypothetical protein A3H22_01310 [Candidatus Per
MGAFVEEFPEEREKLSLEDDLFEASWSRYHTEIAAIQRDLHRLRQEVVHRLAQVATVNLERDPSSYWAVENWLRQETHNLEGRLEEVLLFAIRASALKRAKRAQAIRKFCDGREKPPLPWGEDTGEGV